MSTRYRTALAASIAVVAACSSSPQPPPVTQPPTETTPPATTTTPPPTTTPTPPPPGPAHVRVIHASPDSAAASVAVYLDGATDATIASLAYRSAWGYRDVPAGEHAVDVRPANAPATSPPVVSARTPALESDRYYTVLAHGLAGADPRLALTPVADDTTAPSAGHTRIRFFHALAGLGAVDICVAGANARAAGTPVFTNVAYGAWGTPAGGQGSYFEALAGTEARLQVRAQHATACSGRVLGTVSVTPPDGGVLTAIAIGRATGRPAVNKELLLCVDVPTSDNAGCNALPITAAR